ncbi:MAG: PAS domain-containing sensor histidine kinase [bacterium]
MKKIRTKLVLSLLVITLLPVFPVYYLVKNLLKHSLEIGFNKNVEMALEHATDISRELYANYKQETVSFAKELAASDWGQKLMKKQNDFAGMFLQKAKSLGVVKIDFFDKNCNLIYTDSSDPQHSFPKLYQNNLRPLTAKQKAEFVNIVNDHGHISAFAPIFLNGVQQGFVVVTKAVDEKFTRGSLQVVKVHQMFKTLDFFQDDLTRGFLFAFFVIYVPIAVFSIGVSYYFSRKITNPLLMLVKGTQKVAAGDWDYRVKVSSRDEVGELVVAFNDMIRTLKEKQDQVIKLEKMAVWREIARILAHEIKNPLTPIQLTVQQMKDKYQGEDPEYRQLLAECSEIVSDEIESLRTLVREFSDFARIPKLNLAPGNLNELVTEVSKLYTEYGMQVDLDSTIPEFHFDYEKLRRVLINLIENSLDSMKGTAERILQVKTSRENNFAVLQVSDNGCGVAPELKDKIFEPYFSTKKSGIGLGLAIVKRIVEEHGGKITLESQEGKGTTFYIKLSIIKNY